MDPLFFFDAAVGLALVAAIVIAAVRPPSLPPTPKWVPWPLVATLPAVVVGRLMFPGPEPAFQVAFILGVIGFALGAVLLLSAEDEADDDWHIGDLEPPPWWPDFERDFHDYARRHSRPRVRV